MKKSNYKIAVVGLWHLGETFSAGLAELGHRVAAIDDNQKVIANFLKNQPPLPEPQLTELIAKNRSAKRLSYTTDLKAIKDCDVFWLTIDTPVNKECVADLKPLYQTIDKAAPYLKDDVLVVVSSQIPVGTSKEIIDRLHRQRPNLNFGYVYTPENLRLGEAVKCFLEPGRVIIGTHSPVAVQRMREIFSPLKTELVIMAPASAEMGKHALNTFLAASVCFANDLADIAEKVGANMIDVTKVLKSDPRIGQKAYLNAGLSFSGWTLNRDLKVLVGLAKKFKIKPSLMAAIHEKNNHRQKIIIQRLFNQWPSLKNKTIAILGLTYKPGTKTLRHSQALEVAADLLKKGATLRLHDPLADEQEINLKHSFFSKDVYATVQKADAVVVMTACPEFKSINFTQLAKHAKSKALFFDPVNFLSEQQPAITKAGLNYVAIGRGDV